METADFVVVGGGIAGASAAFELSNHGTVVLLEREATLGYHTTGRSAAMFTEAYESGVVRRLTMASRSFLEEPPDGFADHPLLRPLPVLFVGREDQREAVQALAQDIAAWGPEVELREGDTVLEVCPVLRPGYASLAVFEPGAQELDVHALHQGFLRGARALGARIRSGVPVSGLRRIGSRWRIATASEQLEAGAVVNAAGAWCDFVAALAGATPIGLQPMRRTAFAFPCPEGVDCRALPFVDDVGEQWYFKPEGPGLLGSLSEETPMEPHDVRHDEADVALAIARIQRAVTFEIPYVSRAWAGLRSFVSDRKPVVGEDPDLSGFYWLAGQGGFGIMTSSAMARALAGLVVEGRLPQDIRALGLDPEELGPGRLRNAIDPGR